MADSMNCGRGLDAGNFQQLLEKLRKTKTASVVTGIRRGDVSIIRPEG
jgi:hypothetical protein